MSTALSSNPYFQAVVAHARSMITFGRGSVDGEPCPLFGGVIDTKSKRVRTALSVPPPGIRLEDFNWCGNNLMHDVPLLETLYALTPLTDDPSFARAADDAIGYFAAHCPDAESGLFPWGEHLQWSFSDRRILPCGFSDGLASFLQKNYLTHDHLAFAPAFFWDRLYQASPQVVTRFAKGLDRHIVNPETFEHNRHAAVGASWRSGPETGTGKDFARHSGFYMFDCLFAYARSGDRDLLDWARRKLRWHLNRRLPSGIVGGCVRSADEGNEGQHDSLATSVHLAAALLPPGTEQTEFADYAHELLDARRRQQRPAPLPATGDAIDDQVWIEGYFRKAPIPLRPANLDHLVFSISGIQAYADSLVSMANWLTRGLSAPPAHLPVLARRFCQLLDTALTGYLISADPALLAGAHRIADWAIRDLFRDGLFMGCSNLKLYSPGRTNCEYHVDPWATPTTPGYYYSVSGTPSLVRNLLRLALVQSGRPDTLGIDLHRR